MLPCRLDPLAPPRPPTIRQVAERAGTSIATVSYVLNDKAGHMRPVVREGVLTAVRELGYVKNAAARSLKGMRRGMLAVLVPQFGNNFFTRICVEVEAVAQQAGYVVAICNSDEDPAQERRILERLVSQQIDGCILSPALSQGANLGLLERHGVPAVILERTVGLGAPGQDFVGHDNAQAGHMATSRLLDAGHRRVGFVGWDSPVPNIHERAQGWRAALRERGVDPPTEWMMLGPLTEQAGREMAARMISLGMTGLVIAHHHAMAKGVLLELLANGQQWARDLSVVLIGTPEWRDLVQPSLACIARPEQAMGREAAALLLRKVATPGHRSPALVLPNSFVPGCSLGPPPQGNAR